MAESHLFLTGLSELIVKNMTLMSTGSGNVMVRLHNIPVVRCQSILNHFTRLLRTPFLLLLFVFEGGAHKQHRLNHTTGSISGIEQCPLLSNTHFEQQVNRDEIGQMHILNNTRFEQRN